jgi:hypothetical protein
MTQTIPVLSWKTAIYVTDKNLPIQKQILYPNGKGENK